MRRTTCQPHRGDRGATPPPTCGANESGTDDDSRWRRKHDRHDWERYERECGPRCRRYCDERIQLLEEEALAAVERPPTPSPAVARKAAVTFTAPATTKGRPYGSRFNIAVVVAVFTILLGVIALCLKMQPDYSVWRVLGSFACSLAAIMVWDVWLSDAVNRE